MKKVSYYIVLLVLAGTAVVSYWIYRQYFKVAEPSFLYFQVDRGDIQEMVRTRGEVVAQKEFELEFPFTGTVEAVYVKEGDIISRGQRLMKLETRDFEIKRDEFEAVLIQRRADLVKLLAGATPEEIAVSEAKLKSAEIGLAEARKNLIDRIKDVYVKSDDAVRAKTDQMFDNPGTTNPLFNIVADNAVKQDINAQRLVLGNVLKNWSADLINISTIDDLSEIIENTKSNTTLIVKLLNTLSPIISNLTASSDLTQTTIDRYRTDLSAARTNVNTGITNLIAAEEKFKLAEVNVTLYKNELSVKKSEARSEDIDIAEARIQEAESRLAGAKEDIRKSTLYAGSNGEVSEIHYEVGEVVSSGSPAVSIIANGYKLQTDISELDIAKVNESSENNVRIELDAFPGRQFEGRIISIDSKEVIKTEDKYYRLNIHFDAGDTNVRSGMSADTTILSKIQKGVLRVPELAIYAEGRDKYVQVLTPGLTKALSEESLNKVLIKTGVTDGQLVEVVSGLDEGQTVVVSAE